MEDKALAAQALILLDLAAVKLAGFEYHPTVKDVNNCRHLGETIMHWLEENKCKLTPTA